ncbi:MAG: class I SAM-dependent methyltransferase [Acidobacteriaceae bacterium]|nr:class I SAM-dependent methyltransferase [Acidobacteriaceae bacterium]MBV9754850.1 class I SAM-dependent methyltransferase [Hyphomicrobiales bacterium]
MVEFRQAESPDISATGLLKRPPNPLRYDGQSEDPNEVAGIIRALTPENVRVLDVGCGTGSLTVIANRGKGNRVVGLEPDSGRSAVARTRGIETFCGYLDDEFIRANGQFDVIVFSDVLEHLASPNEMLKRAMDGLRPGGIILASVPNVAHWSLRLKLLFGRFDYTDTGLCDATHLRWFTEQSIKGLFLAQGLEILDVRHTVGYFLQVYRSGYFKVAPDRLLRKSIRTMTKLYPRLFACQFVIKARKPK